MSRVRIAITGIGLVTPLGENQKHAWKNLLAGRSAGRYFSHAEFDSPSHDQSLDWYGAAVEIDPVEVVRSRSATFALLAAREALLQAAIPASDLKKMACVIGTSKTDLRAVDELFADLKQISSIGPPTQFRSLFPSDPAMSVAAEYGMEGPVLCPVAACATGLVSLIRAAELIRQGDAAIAIAGSTDSSLHAGLLSSYRRLGVLAKPGKSPASACRPFDTQRSGFIVGEGAATLVLEEWNSAVGRGVVPIAEWVDGLIGSDPIGLTAVDSSGEPLAALILRLLERNQLQPNQISAICYHGTATKLNDITEAYAISQVFPQVPLGFGVKGALGHLMGAAGSVETAFSALAIRDQVIPPTVNHDQHDPKCPNRVSGPNANRQPIDYLIKTSLGFGGHLAVCLLKRAEL